MGKSCFILAVLSVIAAAGAADAETRSSSPVIIVNLSAPQRGFLAMRAQALDEALAELTGAASPVPVPKEDVPVTEPGDRVDFLVTACKPDENGRPQPLTELVKRLYECADCLRAFSESRFTTRRHDTVVLIVLYDARKIPDSRNIIAVFQEASRDSELVATGKALLSLIRKETQPQGEQPACMAVTHDLQYKRSRLKVTVGARGPAAAQPLSTDALIQPLAKSGEPETIESPHYLLGPQERWFFSTDFSVEQASVKLNEIPTVPGELVKSKDFFIALNFALADILADRESTLQRRSFLKELVLKAQVTPSKEPWEAWAVGIGLRGYRVRTILWNMDVVHPFVVVGRQALPGDERQLRVAFGFGFDPRSFTRD